MTNVALKAVNQYQSADNSSIAYADPHELILRLMNGAMERIAQAKGAIKHKETGQKGEFIGKAISIIGGLEGCLDNCTLCQAVKFLNISFLVLSNLVSIC